MKHAERFGLKHCFLLVLLIPTLALAQNQEDLGRQVHQLFESNCYSCHGEPGKKVRGGFDFILDFERLRSDKNFIDLENPEESYLFERILTEEMPPGDRRKFNSEELELVFRWLAEGAPLAVAGVETAKPSFASYSYLVDSIAIDQQSFTKEKLRHIRYLSLAHMPNSGDTEEMLDIYRDALKKLVNSLSLAEDVFLLEPIDSRQLIFRIDLSRLKWTRRDWDTIGERNPYDVDRDDPKTQAIQFRAESLFPVIRGDWFAFDASRPPTYHRLLRIPDSDLDLEATFIGLNVAKNIEEDRIDRAGFLNSGVSENNRIIERHRSRFGYYWKSYDFFRNTGDSSIFLKPLGPGEGGFEHAGGEIIYSLPNGFQAYMLVDSDGTRLDTAPIEIVQDSSRRNSTIINGISCMSCHVQGMRRKRDEIREYVESNQLLFDQADRDRILEIYSGNNLLEQLFAEDENRFSKALRLAGLKNPNSAVDPIRLLVDRFEDDVDIRRAAAELWVEISFLEEIAAQNVELKGLLYQLTSPNGISRESFISVHGRVHGLIEKEKVRIRNSVPNQDFLTEMGMEFSFVPKGEFSMGIHPNWPMHDRDNDDTIHTVTLSRNLKVQKTEVTQEQWMSIFSGMNPSDHKSPRHPVEQITWWSALVFANEVSIASGLPSCYQIDEAYCEDRGLTGIFDDAGSGKLTCDNEALFLTSEPIGDCEGFRLPLEVEWEYASADSHFGWFLDNSGDRTHAVATFPPGGKFIARSNLGLFDMMGNVWEWVHDTYEGESGPALDPVGPMKEYSRIRGGSYDCAASFCMHGDSQIRSKNEFASNIGFRLFRTIPE